MSKFIGMNMAVMVRPSDGEKFISLKDLQLYLLKQARSFRDENSQEGIRNAIVLETLEELLPNLLP